LFIFHSDIYVVIETAAPIYYVGKQAQGFHMLLFFVGEFLLPEMD